MRQKIENIKRKVGVYRELNRVSHNFKQATILKLSKALYHQAS